ncbi:MAG: Thiol-disulfide oxidoreductase ResA [Anaerolineae bacterium]|nr:Thiol-disulfide oxidoreductase ResA [Anaerolineae bacterium]
MYGNTVADNLSPAETEGLAGAITGPLRSPGQIWRQALSLYWRNWPELTAIAGAGYILLVIGALILGAGVFWLASLSTVPGSLLLAVLLVAGALYLSLIHCAILAAVALSLFENRPFSLQEIFGPVLRQGKNLVVAVLVLLAAAVVVLVMGGIPVLGWLVAPGVLFYLGVIGSLAPVALVAEALPGAWAVARGWRLSRLHFWRTLLVIGGPMLAGWLILALPTLAMLALNLPLQLTDIWLPLLLGVFVTPVYAAVAALAYVDLQVRRPEQAANPAGLVTPAELGKFALLSVGVVLVGGVLAAGGYAAVALAPVAANELAAQEAVGSAAPDFVLDSLAGEPASLAQFKGKPTIINFWATWCPPCKEELPALERAYRQNQAQVNFVAISVKEETDIVRGYVQAESLGLPVALDTSGAVADRFQVRGLPTTVFLDADGVIVGRHLGGLTDESLAGYLASLLARE